MSNRDEPTVAGFGDEWSTFDQAALDDAEVDALFAQYFAILPWSEIPPEATAVDVGCGSGRWARRVAPRVGTLHLLDASAEALDVARRNLSGHDNCRFHHAGVDDMAGLDGTADLVYSLGVLHHVPDTPAALEACARLLRPGATLLVYLYYAFDNRPAWYRALWRASDAVRRIVSRAPHRAKLAVSLAFAALVYWPLARGGRAIARVAPRGARHLPLSYYADRSYYTMRTDAYDRFGTRLEQRFTREEIRAMLTGAGLEDVVFSEGEPYWCATARRAA